MRDRALVALVVLPLVAAGFVGCSDGGGDADVISVAAVAEATGGASTARLRLDVVYVAKDAARVTEGVIDLRSGDARYEYRAGTEDLRIAMGVTVDGEMFLTPTSPPDDGPSWVRLVSGGDGLGIDPVALVDKLADAAGDVEVKGSGEVHGDRTTTYRLALRSGSSVLALLMIPPDEPAAATMDVDASGRLRRLVVEPDEPSPATAADDGDGDGEMPPVPRRAALELWDFGVAVDVERPNADDVVDVDDPQGFALLSRALAGVPVPADSPSDGVGLGPSELRGPFTRVAAGGWEHVDWEMWEAETTDGLVCHTFEREPRAHRAPTSSGTAIPCR